MPVRLLVAIAILIAAFLVMFLVLIATETALTVWHYLRQAPLWVQVGYGFLLVGLPLLYVALHFAAAGMNLYSPDELQLYNNTLGRVMFIGSMLVRYLGRRVAKKQLLLLGFGFINSLLEGDHLKALGKTPFDEYTDQIWVVIGLLFGITLFKAVAMTTTFAAGGAGARHRV